MSKLSMILTDAERRRMAKGERHWGRVAGKPAPQPEAGSDEATVERIAREVARTLAQKRGRA